MNKDSRLENPNKAKGTYALKKLYIITNCYTHTHIYAHDFVHNFRGAMDLWRIVQDFRLRNPVIKTPDPYYTVYKGVGMGHVITIMKSRVNQD